MSFHATIITQFPEMFPGFLGHSLAGAALRKKIWSWEAFHLRDFAHNKHRNIDGAPAGGGAGMVCRADVACAAIDAAQKKTPDFPLVYLTPRGNPLQQNQVEKWAKGKGLILFCSRFEGVDERVMRLRKGVEVSIGDYILAGGEPAALVVLDALIRLLPEVMGKGRSLEEESFANGLLEYPHYTKPQRFEDMDIPEVLLSGNHAEIEKYRREQAERRTKKYRADLWENYRKK